MPGDSRVLIILGRPFLATAREMINVFNKKITLRVRDDEVIFDIDQSIKRPPTEDDKCYGIDDLDDTINAEAQELLANDEPDSFLSRGLEKSIDQSDLEDCKLVECNNNNDSNKPIWRIAPINTSYSVDQETTELVKLEREHLYSAIANEIDEKKPKLKDLPNHLECAYLHAIAWKMSDIKEISPSYCTHKILMEYDFKPVIQPQRRLNPKVKDVVKNEIVKLLDSALIYPISDSSWVSPIHVVPKKGGMNVVLNDDNELIPSRTVTRWRVCIDYHKLNNATRKDHFPLPFIDQMLERLCGNEYYYFLDGFSRFFQILIALEDQEKTTFTCPYGTFAYRRMPFGMQRSSYLSKMHDGFDIEIKDKRGAENLAADHLSRLENPELSTFTKEEIADEFPDEHLMALKTEINNDEPWYADYVNYLVGKIVPPNWTPEKRRRFFSQVKNYFWDEPYAFKLCPDNIMRRCVAGNEISKILAHCHSGPTGGHHSASVTGRRVYEIIFKDAKDYVVRCDACQRSGNISSRSEMPQNNIQVCDVFDVWGLDFMGPFPNLKGKKYILVAVDYVSKWVRAQALPTNDARVVIKFLKRLFARFGVPKALISDRGTHFFNSQLEKALQKYGVTHKLPTTYHPQTNGQTEVTNRAIKRILERSFGYNLKNWSEKLYDALWAFRTAYKTPTGCTPFRLVYGKSCHLSLKIEHKAYWALKQCNMDLITAAKNRFMELNELIELRDNAYENTRIYKETTKKWHDSRLQGDKDFKVGDLVLLFNSRFKMHPGKLKSRCYGPNVVKTMYPYGTVEITDKNGVSFKVNGQRFKKYHERHIDTEDKEVVEFKEDTT
ncbi:reverse transcriptase domain-containing protein [Tanacetum coccineum]